MISAPSSAELPAAVKPLTPAQRIAQIMREACSQKPMAFLKRVSEGLAPNIEDQRHNTLLHHLAKKKGRLPVVRWVLEHPSCPVVDRVNIDGDTALSLAAGAGYAAMVDRLIQAGANVNHRNHIGRGPLHEAAQGWHPEMVSALLAAGASPDQRATNARDAERAEVSPLAYVLYENPKNEKDAQRQLDTMRRLLDAGADPNWPHGALVMPNLHRAIGKPLATLDLLLKHGADPNLRYPHFNTTALMVACEYNLSSPQGVVARARAAVDLLIAAGADVTLADHKGWTALHMAVRHNDAGWIHALVRAGADPLARALDGKTPMDAATMRVGTPPEATILALTLAETVLSRPIEARARARL